MTDAQQPVEDLTIEELARSYYSFNSMPSASIALLARTILELRAEVAELREWKDREDTYRFERNR
jgi:hypothetical protein